MKYIGNEAFYNCYSLKDIVFPNSLESIGYQSFVNTSLVDLILPSNLLSIGEKAFMNVSSIDKITFGPKVEFNGVNIFSLDNNISLTIKGEGKMIDYQDSNYSPWSCIKEKITDISISEGILSIGDNSFENTSVSKISIPSSVKVIGTKSFSNNLLLSTVSFNGDIDYIGDGAFINCKNLKSVEYNSNVIPKCAENVFNNTIIEKIIVGSEPSSLSNFCGKDITITEEKKDNTLIIVVSVIVPVFAVIILIISIIVIVIIVMRKRKPKVED